MLFKALSVSNNPVFHSDLLRAAGSTGKLLITSTTTINKFKLNPDVFDFQLVFFETEIASELDFLKEVIGNQDSMLVVVSSSEVIAARAFEIRAFDCITKPVTTERLQLTLDFLESRFKDSAVFVEDSLIKNQNNRYFIKDREKYYWIKLEDIIYFKGLGNYVKIYFSDISPTFYGTLGALEKKLPPGIFFRANRSYLVNLNFVNEIKASNKGLIIFKMSNQSEIELSLRQSRAFKEKMAL